ncbi:MAG: TolC family protein, partial [Paraprevotella sp.]|nr:TolC family protein [Paraprevotella sp.]
MKNKIICLIAVCLALSAQAQVDTLSHPSVTLQDCLVRGLESNYGIRMVKNRQQVSDNNATIANAGMLPTVDLSASYSGNLHTTRSTSRTTELTTIERNALDGTLDAGVDLNWTVFDGFSIWANYKQLKLLKEQGEIQTRLAI